MSRVRVAAAQYDVGFHASFDAYAQKVRRWVAEAATQGAGLLVFPEYFSMELVSLFPESVRTSLSYQLDALQSVLPDFLDLFRSLAREHGVYIVAGSYPVRVSGEHYRNRAYLLSSDGTVRHQDKIQMTRFENEAWGISPGDTLEVFETSFGCLGIAICYDSEFPLLARRQVEAGATLIAVPSCTDTRSGYWRVRIGCQARALENQCYVVQAPLVGTAEWSPAVDVSTGKAGVYTPVDIGFPEDGVLASGTFDLPQWVYADVDLAEVARVRASGQVFNHRDWDGQHRAARCAYDR
ncbi:MAG: amidohydrolase [Proteobacteria bacterium]|nr:amidohydrolase [Pseudomonadota bacterium]